jgi:hypothetical protein
MLNQNALDASKPNRTVSTGLGDPLNAIIEKGERDTRDLRNVLCLLALALVYEAVYVFCFRKV